MTRKEIDLVAVWAVDRLGRSLQDLVTTLSEIHDKKVDLYLHQQSIDTTTSGGKALFGMMGVFAEFERDIIRERVSAGIARAKEQGTRSGRPIGRPVVHEGIRDRALELKADGMGSRKIAEKLGVSRSSVIKALRPAA